MDVFKTHGAISWSELMVDDPSAAAAFYAKLFGWQFQQMDMGSGPYRVIKIGDDAIGGIMGQPPDQPKKPPMWGSYVTVEDIDATVKRCVELGGKLCAGPMEIPTVGRMAVMQDPQGATISAITYKME